MFHHFLVKRLEREVEYSPPSSAAVKNVWGYTSIPQYVFMAWYLVKHRILVHGVALGLPQGKIYFYFLLLKEFKTFWEYLIKY
jgi:hypothetical protein